MRKGKVPTRTRADARTASFSDLYGKPDADIVTVGMPDEYARLVRATKPGLPSMWRPWNTTQMAQASLLADTIVDAAYEAGLIIVKGVNCAANDGVRPTFGLALALMRRAADFTPVWPAQPAEQRGALHRVLAWECPLWLLIPLAFTPFAIQQVLTFGGPLYGWLTK